MKILKEYTLTEGKFLTEGEKEFSPIPRQAMEGCINIYPEVRQEILGFGGALTESSAYNYSKMTREQKEQTLEYLFGESGLNYNFCRLCIGSSDFTLSPYSYIEENDYELKTFSIENDKKYIIPFVSDALKFTENKLTLFASPWSPPAFMKDNNSLMRGGKLKKECYPIYAEYICKYLLAYKKEGISVSVISLQNEPNAVQPWESCVFNAEDEIAFTPVISEALKKNGLDVKIICWDHNKGDLYNHAKAIYSAVGDKVWGMGFHWYDGSHFDELDIVNKLYPNKMLIESEFCNTVSEWHAGSYCEEMLGNIKNGANAVIEWNLILDSDGGPFHNRVHGCDAPIRFIDGEVKKPDIYYQAYMFSHFIKKGAKVLYTSTCNEKVKITAVKNPDGKIVAVIINDSQEKLNYRVKIGYTSADICIEPDSVKTLIIE